MRGTNAVLGAIGLAVFLALGGAAPRLGLVKEAYVPPVGQDPRSSGQDLSR